MIFSCVHLMDGYVRFNTTIVDRLCIPYCGFLPWEKRFENCLKIVSRRKHSRICGNPVHHAH